MKKIISFLLAISFLAIALPRPTMAAGGIYASGGGTKTVGQTFTITVTASGADFDSLQGTVSVSGPVDIVSFSGGGATWLPGKSPDNGKEFVGICSPTSSLSVITIKLKGKSTGNGTVSVAGVKVARNGVVTGTGAGSANFTIERALVPPGTIVVTSSTHPDQNTPYEATTVSLAWEKPVSVTGYSYIFDTVAGTTPPTKAVSTTTSVSYENQAIGTYYFHIRGQNGDGWGPTTHFKVTIKEPDAKINNVLKKPSGIAVKKANSFVNNPTDGTVAGIIISGKTEAGYTAIIKLTPTPTLPEGKTFSAKADSTGNFELLISFPIPAGLYRLTVQGQLEKVLTPLSDEIKFEISQAKGGNVNILTDTDKLAPVVPKLKWYEKTLQLTKTKVVVALSLLGLIVVAILVMIIVRLKRKRNLKKIAKSIKVNAE